MFKNLSIRIKLGLAFLLIAALVGGAGYFQVRSLSHANEIYSDLIENDFTRHDTLDVVRLIFSELEKSAIETGLTQPGPQQVATANEEISIYQANLEEAYKTYRQHLADDSEQVVEDATVDTLKGDTEAFVSAARTYVQSLSGSPAQISIARQQMQEAASQATQNLENLIKLEDERIEEEDEEVTSSVAQVMRTVIWLVIAVAVIAVLLGLIIADTLSRSLRRLKTEAQYIASGDFSRKIPVTTSDEIGQAGAAFNDMAVRLRASYLRLAIETERTKTLLESLGEGVLAIDEKTNISVINGQALQLLDFNDRDRLFGMPVNHVIALLNDKDEPLSGSDTPVVNALETRKIIKGVYGFRRGDVTLKLEITASPILVDNKLTGAIMNLRDVTKEKEVDRMKTEFISLASHQLRTPLSAIKWFSEMLLSGDAGKLNPDQEEFARNVVNSTERMIALVNALLNISRIESGRIMIDPKPTDLRELVSGIVSDLKAKTEEKQQSLIISVHEDLPKINVDPRLVGQVYLNLLTNAVKYTPKGGEISVFISRKGDEVISQVTDNGLGIPIEQQSRVFQKFFRAANAVKVETDGTGLGLYLIKAVIESSGGRIWFKSDEGKGTTFWFSIPLAGMTRKEGEVTLDV